MDNLWIYIIWWFYQNVSSHIVFARDILGSHLSMLHLKHEYIEHSHNSNVDSLVSTRHFVCLPKISSRAMCVFLCCTFQMISLVGLVNSGARAANAFKIHGIGMAAFYRFCLNGLRKCTNTPESQITIPRGFGGGGRTECAHSWIIRRFDLFRFGVSIRYCPIIVICFE